MTGNNVKKRFIALNVELQVKLKFKTFYINLATGRH